MKRWHWITLAILTVVSFIVELFFIEGHEEYWWAFTYGFFIIFGFAGCIIIIVFSKFLGKLFLQKREDYYDK
jgi:hypothetical protein